MPSRGGEVERALPELAPRAVPPPPSLSDCTATAPEEPEEPAERMEDEEDATEPWPEPRDIMSSASVSVCLRPIWQGGRAVG